MIGKQARFGLLMATLLMSGGALAAAPAHQVLRLYAGPAPGSTGATQRESSAFMFGEQVVRNVTEPTLTIYQPAPGTATHTAVVVAPGGGFEFLAYDVEGTQVAEALAAHGVTAVLLKYRVGRTDIDPGKATAQVADLWTPRPPQTIETRFPIILHSIGAQQGIADARQAMRLVRQHAAEWGIAANRIGFLGFSAAGLIATELATHHDAATRPDFVGCLYGGLVPGTQIPADAPPIFLAVATDDRLLAGATAPIFTAWRAAGHDAELHEYRSGGHGFGMTVQGTTSDHWFDAFVWWMGAEGLLKK